MKRLPHVREISLKGQGVSVHLYSTGDTLTHVTCSDPAPGVLVIITSRELDSFVGKFSNTLHPVHISRKKFTVGLPFEED